MTKSTPPIPEVLDVKTPLDLNRDNLLSVIIESDVDSDFDNHAEERGRLERHRRQSSHSPARAPSLSRGHDRHSGSWYREHHRKHHRFSSPSSSVSPPNLSQKKARRRSDAEPDHTFRGRPRNRSPSAQRTKNSNLDDDAVIDGEVQEMSTRKRSAPPSRHRVDSAEEGREVRRQRSYPNLYKEDSIGAKVEY